MHLHWRSVIVKTPPVTYVERTNKSYFYGICLGWEETNPSNIREHPYLTSVSMPSAWYHEGRNTNVCRVNTEVRLVGFHPLIKLSYNAKV
jgi:hypothetical protein